MVQDIWGVDMKGVACYCGRCGSGCVPHSRSGGRQALAGCGRPGLTLGPRRSSSWASAITVGPPRTGYCAARSRNTSFLRQE